MTPGNIYSKPSAFCSNISIYKKQTKKAIIHNYLLLSTKQSKIISAAANHSSLKAICMTIPPACNLESMFIPPIKSINLVLLQSIWVLFKAREDQIVLQMNILNKNLEVPPKMYFLYDIVIDNIEEVEGIEGSQKVSINCNKSIAINQTPSQIEPYHSQ